MSGNGLVMAWFTLATITGALAGVVTVAVLGALGFLSD